MANLIRRLRGDVVAARAGSPVMYFNGQPHTALQSFPQGSLPGAMAETIGTNLEGLVSGVRDANAVVAAAVHVRASLVSQARFTWRDLSSGRLWGNRSLQILDQPGSMTRPELLYRIEEDACWAGNAYVLRSGDSLYRLRPDWVDILISSKGDPSDPGDATTVVAGYAYWPGGVRHGAKPVVYDTSQVAHFAPEPHPTAWYLGASWVASLIRDVQIDHQAHQHISNYLENAATANMVVAAPQGVGSEQFAEWVDRYENAHAGGQWSNMYVAAGTDVRVVGSSLSDLNMGALTGGFEARVAVRSRVPAAVLGTREGLQGSSLNAGNYTATRRLWADGWYTPHLDMLCAALGAIVEVPPVAELAYRRDSILFLQEDQADMAAIQATQASAIRTLIDAGFEPDTARDAVLNDDYSLLTHTGLAPVQVQALPGSDQAQEVPQ